MMPSLLAFAAPFNSSGKYFQHQMFAIGKVPLPWEPNTVTERNFPGGKDFQIAYHNLFGFDYLSMGIDMTSTMSGAYIRSGCHR